MSSNSTGRKRRILFVQIWKLNYTLAVSSALSPSASPSTPTAPTASTTPTTPPTSQPPTTSSIPPTTSSVSSITSTTQPTTTSTPPSVRSTPTTTSSTIPTVAIVTPTPTTPSAITTVITSTRPPVTIAPAQSSSISSTSTSLSATASATSAPPSSGGLTTGGKIAIAVVVPVVSVTLIVLALLFLWRRRKQKKSTEEMRRKEVEEYGYNPNQDPTLPAAGVASSNGDEGEMSQADGAGYRGWGATSTARKPSTNLSGGNGPVGMAYSEGAPPPGGQTAELASDGPSSPGGRTLDDKDAVGALGGGPAAGGNRDIHRGPSNASSSYSAANRSDVSGEAPIPVNSHSTGYGADGAYYDDANYHAGPYGDGSYGGAQPVIRDVPARRNTRIENPTVVPQQGNAGIAQNF
ncbi:MAG: hypothetical protein M1814_000336 [Vezdaea aestivalis]|nr:MAG: hypothetical protein M1814_000336 [Vezdaea aestivalis]